MRCRISSLSCNAPARARRSANGLANRWRRRTSSWSRTASRVLVLPARTRSDTKAFMPPVIKLSSPETKDYWEIPVLFEDDALLAIDKPSGLLVSPDRYDPMRPNIMKLFHRDIARGAKWVQERGLTYLANAHRLDF